jgi:hypothetical protein
MRWRSAASFSEGLTFIFLRIPFRGARAPVLNEIEELVADSKGLD